jgi:hypothetical protein
MRATCATYLGKTIRHRLVIWAARSRARPCNRAARAAAVCGSAIGSRSFPLDRRCASTTVRWLPCQGNGFVGPSYSGTPAGWSIRR